MHRVGYKSKKLRDLRTAAKVMGPVIISQAALKVVDQSVRVILRRISTFQTLHHRIYQYSILQLIILIVVFVRLWRKKETQLIFMTAITAHFQLVVLDLSPWTLRKGSKFAKRQNIVSNVSITDINICPEIQTINVLVIRKENANLHAPRMVVNHTFGYV